MLKKFTAGLVFGAGFGISFLALWYLAAYLITPMYARSQIEHITHQPLSDTDTRTQSSVSRNPQMFYEAEPPFQEMQLEEKIRKSSVIALAKYEPSPDGKMKAIIREFLKIEPGTTLYYKVGDEHASSSYYPKNNTSYGDGLVIFFVGSPAEMRMSMSYEGDRIRGLGDLPIELLKIKCKAPNT